MIAGMHESNEINWQPLMLRAVEWMQGKVLLLEMHLARGSGTVLQKLNYNRLKTPPTS
jgi:hypothetical protein